MNKLKKLLITLSMSATCATNAQLVGELGILDLTANGGNNPATGSQWQAGDQYRLVFLTSGATDALSSDITTYNAFVQGLAATAGLGDTTWNIVGSTVTVDARDNTGTNPETTGFPVFLMDGATVIATNNADLWDGTNTAVGIDENGEVVATQIDRVFTGTNPNGTKVSGVPDQPLGNGDAENNIRTGRGDTAGGSWMTDFNFDENAQQRVFAMSAPLTVGTGTSTEIAITNIDFNADTSALSLTWTSNENVDYIVRYSLDLNTWTEDLGILISGDAGESTTRVLDLSTIPELTGDRKVFFRIEFAPPPS